jgi:cobalt-zinc-cadmium efflux system outer membrane protein
MRWIAVLALASGCAGVVKERGHDRVAALVAQRTGLPTGWGQGPPDDARVAEWVRATVARGLTRAAAVQIALVNSPELLVDYEGLGIAQADLVQAGLLRNPSFSMDLGVNGAGALAEVRLALVQDFLDLLTLSARKQIARAQFEADTLRVAERALDLAAEAEKAFVDAQTASELVGFQRTVVDTASAAVELSSRQLEAGNISPLDHATQRASYEQARLDLNRQEMALAEARARVDRLLGLWGEGTGWRFGESLARLPADDGPFERLESFALRQRLDLAAARQQGAVLERALSLARTTRLFGRVEVGVDAHRDPEGSRVFGPNMVIELPIFDQRQATIARLVAQRRQQERRLTALAVAARAEVRAAVTRLRLSRQAALQYRETVVPLRQSILEQTQQHYNGMFVGLYQLLVVKQGEVEARRGYLESLRDYWMARADLTRAVGGALPPSSKEQTHE